MTTYCGFSADGILNLTINVPGCKLTAREYFGNHLSVGAVAIYQSQPGLNAMQIGACCGFARLEGKDTLRIMSSDEIAARVAKMRSLPADQRCVEVNAPTVLAAIVGRSFHLVVEDQTPAPP